MNPLVVHSPVMDGGKFRHFFSACLHHMAAANKITFGAGG
jgi:hypothetical protein